jgi:outer membrane protein OmpA-like peptidoglycan-associated protein
MRRVARTRSLATAGALAVIVAAGCGPKRIAQPSRPTDTLIALLPDPESGVTGRARVSNEFGSADLNAPRAATLAAADRPLQPVHVIDEAEAARLFGEAFAALPPAPRHFTLQFRFESDALTDASTALVPTILKAVKDLAVPEVVVVGHTDTMGDPKANVALGLKRAMSVRNILIKAGLAPSTIEVTSHGEADLLIKTPNGVAEPRNRRVEITVK